MPSNHLLVLTDQNFQKMVLQSEVPTLVDFWADWCEPCHVIAPHVAAVALEYQGKIRVGKMDIDKSPGIPTDYNIRSIPTLLFFKGDKVIGQVVGAVSKAKLGQFINDSLQKIS